MRTNLVVGACAIAALVAASAAEAAGYRMEKRLAMAAGGEFSLRSEAGSVDVVGGEGSEARVVVTSDRDDFARLFEVRFDDSDPARVEVTIERRGTAPFKWFGGWSGDARVAVELPRAAAAEIHASGGSVELSGLDGRVRAESSGGHLFAERLGSDVALSSSGGGVEVRDVGGSARLRSSGGSVVASGVRGDLEASSSGGGVRVTGAGGEVVASSSGGPVKVEFAPGNGRGGSIGSSGGGVEVRVDPAAALDIDAHSSGGGITCDLAVTVRGKISRSSLRGQLNGGGAVLKLRSSGGGIRIEER